MATNAMEDKEFEEFKKKATWTLAVLGGSYFLIKLLDSLSGNEQDGKKS